VTALLAALAALVAPAAPALRPAPGIDVPSGHRAELYATGLRRPTALAWGPDGLLYATQESGELVAVGRGSARPRVVAQGFDTPLGLAFQGQTVFVSAKGTLWRATLSGRRLAGKGAILKGLPFGRHQQDNVVVGPDGRLYLGSGSTCDACRERDPRSAAILSVRPDGSGLRIVARGLRNPYGLLWFGRTLYVSVNNRDDLGTWEPAETIVALTPGARYGWPDCWPSWRMRRLAGSCAGVARPLAYLEPHSSANGLGYWRGSLFVAEWGQYFKRQFGRKLVRVDPRRRRARTFATGFEHPLAVLAEPSGDGLLVADHGRGTIVRITVAASSVFTIQSGRAIG
jgi:glucose/arabinose dehydrogenase